MKKLSCLILTLATYTTAFANEPKTVLFRLVTSHSCHWEKAPERLRPELSLLLKSALDGTGFLNADTKTYWDTYESFFGRDIVDIYNNAEFQEANEAFIMEVKDKVDKRINRKAPNFFKTFQGAQEKANYVMSKKFDRNFKRKAKSDESLKVLSKKERKEKQEKERLQAQENYNTHMNQYSYAFFEDFALQTMQNLAYNPIQAAFRAVLYSMNYQKLIKPKKTEFYFDTMKFLAVLSDDKHVTVTFQIAYNGAKDTGVLIEENKAFPGKYSFSFLESNGDVSYRSSAITEGCEALFL